MGRNAIYLAIGFTTLCLMTGLNLSRVSLDAFSNAITYQENSNILNIAETGANFACNQLFTTPNWRTGFQNVPFGGGTFTVTVNMVVNGTDSSRIQVISAATYQGLKDTIKILLQPSLFSKFAYFSDNEPSSISWTTGDTVWGPYHSNTSLYVSGNPVFNGKATAQGGVVKNSNPSNPVFNGGFQSGVSITMPSDLSALQGKAQQTGGGFYLATSSDFYLTFNSNGTVNYRLGTSGSWTTQTLTAFAGTNKVVVINGGNIHVKGILNGQVTIAALSSNSNNGQVWIDSSVAYNSNPVNNPASTDMLGICATNNIEIASNSNNNNSSRGVTIQGSLFSLKGGFGADSATTKVPSGSIHLLGGVSQAVRQAVGVVGGTHGYLKSYYYDNRFLVSAPPCFPTTGSYEVLEWWE
ncbi:MAG TPA: hypothetical protein VMF88_05985 [Bacteroidota bacterium]|nr:hypothetical protein [Bacteroidota bacterium]